MCPLQQWVLKTGRREEGTRLEPPARVVTQGFSHHPTVHQWWGFLLAVVIAKEASKVCQQVGLRGCDFSSGFHYSSHQQRFTGGLLCQTPGGEGGEGQGVTEDLCSGNFVYQGGERRWAGRAGRSELIAMGLPGHVDYVQLEEVSEQVPEGRDGTGQKHGRWRGQHEQRQRDGVCGQNSLG